MVWRKDIIFLANVLPAGVNFFTSLLLAKFIGFELAGIWFFFRSFCQISVSISPGFLLTFLIKRDYRNRENSALKIAKDLTVFWSLVNFIIFSIILFFVDESTQIINLLIIFFWLSLSVYNYYSTLLRINLNGKAILVVSVFDTVVSLLILLSLFFLGLEWFILFNCFKFLFKAFLAKYLLDRPLGDGSNVMTFKFASRNDYVSSAKELFKIGGGLSFKGGVQTFSQYGDKFLFGFMLSNELLGVVALGSSMAVPFAIIMSSFYTWSLPFINQRSYIADNIRVFIYLLIFVFVYPFFSVAAFLVYDLSLQDFMLLLSSMCFVLMQIGLNFSCALLFNRLGTWISSFLQFTIIFISYAITYVVFYFKLDFIEALSFGSIFLLFSMFFILFYVLKLKAVFVLFFGFYLVAPIVWLPVS